MKLLIIPLIYFVIGVSFLYLSKRIFTLKSFVIVKEKSILLKNFALLCLTFSVFEIYLGSWAIVYYLSYLDLIIIFKSIVFGAIIALSLISSFNLRMSFSYRESNLFKIFDLSMLLLDLILIGTILFAKEYSFVSYILLIFVIISISTICLIFFKFSISRIHLIKSKDPIERASGLGALIALIGGLLSAFFFAINRMYGSLFGFIAVLSQISLLVMLYGFYVNLEPPNFLINLFESSE